MSINGTVGNDRLSGTARNDIIYGSYGNDYIDGGAGNDHIQGNAGDDYLIGGAGNDGLSGGSNNDYLIGGDGNDYLDGSIGNDYLDGGTGNDTLVNSPGNDTLTGGLGADIFRFPDHLLGNVNNITDFSRQQGDKVIFNLNPRSNKLYELSYNKNSGVVSLSGQAIAILSNKPDYLLATDFGIQYRGITSIGISTFVRLSNFPDDLYVNYSEYESHVLGRTTNAVIAQVTGNQIPVVG